VTSPVDLSGRHLYLCTPDRPDLASFLSDCIGGGVDVVQLRDKQLDARPLLERARVALAVCRDHGVPFVLNGADGVHVGQDDASVGLARRILGPDVIVGLSTHRREELERALAADVDYLSAGPVEPTPTKPGRRGTGLTYVRQASARASVPVFVTGGVTPEKVPTLSQAGVRHFVVVRYLTEASDARGAARSLRDAIDRALSTEPPAA